MFRLTVLPAEDGDCLLLTYGDAAPFRHILVDGGRGSTYALLKPRLKAIADAGEELELLVLTHVDADHIEGVLKLALDPELPTVPKRVWYNGFDQMNRIKALSIAQGDAYSERLAELGWSVNADFEGSAVSIEASPEPFDVAGLKVTLVSPDAAHLGTMRSKWAAWRTADEARRAAKQLRNAGGLKPMGRKPMPPVLDVEALSKPTPTDPEPPNGSSIAFIAEWGGRRILFAADAHPDLMATRLGALRDGGGRLKVDLFKVSHHGSHGNTTREVVEQLDCSRFLISTNGTRHGHPDPEAISRLLRYAPEGPRTLIFNYRTGRTTPWDDDDLKAKWSYEVEFPAEDGVLEIDI